MNQHWVKHLEDAGYGVWDWDLDADRVNYSKRWKSILGYDEDEIGELFSEFQSRVHPDDLEGLLVNFNEHLAGITPAFVHEFRIQAKDQSYRWVVSQGSVLERDAHGKALRLVGIHQDITESKRALEELVEHKKFINRVMNSTPIFFYVHDLESRQNIYCNDAIFTVLGYTVEEFQARGSSLIESPLFHIDDLPKLATHFQALTDLADGEVRELDYRVRCKSGEYLVIRSRDVVFKRDQQGRVTQVVGTAVDITELKEAELKLAYLTNYDPLTGLINRSVLHTRLKHAMQICKRQDVLVAVCFIDLDDFKFINDRYGHSVGDKVLIEVAHRLQNRVREEDSLSRVGGDEFILVIERLPDEKTAFRILNELLHIFDEPVVVEKSSFKVSISMGVSFFPQHGDSVDLLSRNADTAMFRAKEAGKNTFKIYHESMSRDLVGRLELEEDLKVAIAEGQFELYYQPKVDLRTSRVIGLEALIRWNHPTKGLVRPDLFIPLAEELRYIVPIGEWVLRKACLDLLELQKKVNFYGTVAVNVSGIQLEKSDFLKSVKKIFSEVDVSPKEIELEITESAIMNNPIRWISLLSELRFLGFKISIDDFGTGYSSLNCLKKLPVNQLKIDKSFVDDLIFDEDANLIVSAVVSLASAMKMGCIAEGIEAESQLHKLIEIGCEQGQGYLFSKPLPLDEIKTWLLDLSSVQNQTLT